MLIAKNQDNSQAPAINELFNNHYNSFKVRSQLVDDKPVFVAKDVCQILGISKYRDALSKLEDFERVSILVDTLGGTQKLAGINESGLYALIFSSRKREAVQFRVWVTNVLLPSIRKFGCYIPLKVNTDGDFAGLMPIQVGGRQLLCYTDVLRKIGRSTKSGSVQARRKRYGNHFFKLFNRNFISIELAQQLKEEKVFEIRRQELQLELPFNQNEGGLSYGK